MSNRDGLVRSWVHRSLLCCGLFVLHLYCRTKAKLQSGEMEIPGDQWPTFLYANNMYDPEDPWKGLLRSSILVCVRHHCLSSFSLTHLSHLRHTNMSLHCQAPLTMLPKLHGLAMLVSMGWPMWHLLPSLTLPCRCAFRYMRFTCMGLTIFLGTVCTQLLIRIL